MLHHLTHAVASVLVTISLFPASCDDKPTTSNCDVEAVNALPYQHFDAGPALQAWEMVTECRNWPEGDAEKWEPFISDVMWGESRYCWNVRGGAKMTGVGCEMSRQGKASDSGFGQLISLHYNPKNGWLCKQEGLCSSAAIISSPFTSMTALVALVERSGGSPWCYSKKARRLHNCNLVP